MRSGEIIGLPGQAIYNLNLKAKPGLSFSRSKIQSLDNYRF
jgi:hypothetical protein